MVRFYNELIRYIRENYEVLFNKITLEAYDNGVVATFYNGDTVDNVIEWVNTSSIYTPTVILDKLVDFSDGIISVLNDTDVYDTETWSFDDNVEVMTFQYEG